MLVFASNLVHMFSGTIPTWHIFYFFEIPPRSPPGGGFPPKLSPDFKQSKYSCICVKFITHVLWHNIHDAYFFFSKLPPVTLWGGNLPPKSPHIEILSDCLEIRYVCSVPHYLTNALFSFPKFPPIRPPGGDFPPKIPKSRNLVRLS